MAFTNLIHSKNVINYNKMEKKFIPLGYKHSVGVRGVFPGLSGAGRSPGMQDYGPLSLVALFSHLTLSGH